MFRLHKCNIGLCYHESGNSALPDMSELVDQFWNLKVHGVH
ncbi:Cysteine-rich receptor-like protein kinase 27 [Trichinella spiralis]|uniref:Cysteine-rich receptor-like protein kinase 27 n=1 Tax=Trichinella spiralis TaxID=6334 RepID=A0ABR3KLT2_TRISP